MYAAVPALDADALADAMIRMWRDPEHRFSMVAGGSASTQQYTFPRWANRMFALYRELLALGERTP